MKSYSDRWDQMVKLGFRIEAARGSSRWTGFYVVDVITGDRLQWSPTKQQARRWLDKVLDDLERDSQAAAMKEGT